MKQQKNIMKPDLMKFEDIYDLRAVKYLYSLDNDDLMEMMIDEKKYKDGLAQPYSVKEQNEYVNWIRYELGKIINSKKSIVATTYKYASSKSSGRIYVEKFGIQKLARHFKELVLPSSTYDYDIKNAMPSILLYLAIKLKLECPKLEEYIENRETILDENNIDKFDVLKCLFSDNITKRTTGWLKKFHTEINHIKAIINNEYRDYAIPSSNSKNPISSALFNVLSHFENLILQKVIRKINKKLPNCVKIPYFDGFISNCELDISMLNEITDDFGVEWCLKPFEKKIIIPEDFDETEVNVLNDYQTVKKNFEETYFYNRKLIRFMRKTINADGSISLNQITKAELKDDCENLFCMVKNKKACFVPRWLEDEDRLTYLDTTFKPYLNEDPFKNTDFYNTFQGFPYKPTSEANEEELEWFFEYLFLLSNKDVKMKEYLENCLAYKLQKPDILMKVILIFQGLQGTGKSLFAYLISKLIGKEHCYETSNLDEVLGQFNATALQNRLFISLEEVENQNGIKWEQQLKDIATRQKNNINQKHQKLQQDDNYILLAMNSNNTIPFKNVPGSRRPVYIKTSYITKGNDKYWKNFISHLENKEDIQNVFNYLTHKDITDFDPARDRVLTEDYKEREKTFIDREWFWLRDVIIDKFQGERHKDFKYSKAHNGFVIAKTKFKDYVNTYLEEHYDERGKSLQQLKHFRLNANITELNKQVEKIKGAYLFRAENDFEELRENVKQQLGQDCFDTKEENCVVSDDEKEDVKISSEEKATHSNIVISDDESKDSDDESKDSDEDDDLKMCLKMYLKKNSPAEI